MSLCDTSLIFICQRQSLQIYKYKKLFATDISRLWIYTLYCNNPFDIQNTIGLAVAYPGPNSLRSVFSSSRRRKHLPSRRSSSFMTFVKKKKKNAMLVFFRKRSTLGAARARFLGRQATMLVGWGSPRSHYGPSVRDSAASGVGEGCEGRKWRERTGGDRKIWWRVAAGKGNT